MKQDDCLFCKIVSGEIPDQKVYEDEKVIGVLDIKPSSKGHLLAIPKKHSRNIFDIEESDLKDLIAAVKKMAIAVKETFGASGVNISMNNEKPAGQIIYHSHVHIVPRPENFVFKGGTHSQYKEGEKEEYRDKIKKYFERKNENK